MRCCRMAMCLLRYLAISWQEAATISNLYDFSTFRKPKCVIAGLSSPRKRSSISADANNASRSSQSSLGSSASRNHPTINRRMWHDGYLECIGRGEGEPVEDTLLDRLNRGLSQRNRNRSFHGRL